MHVDEARAKLNSWPEHAIPDPGSALENFNLHWPPERGSPMVPTLFALAHLVLELSERVAELDAQHSVPADPPES